MLVTIILHAAKPLCLRLDEANATRGVGFLHLSSLTRRPIGRQRIEVMTGYWRGDRLTDVDGRGRAVVMA